MPLFVIGLSFKPLESALIRNMRFLTFSFITTTFHNILDETAIKIINISLHILPLIITLDVSERC